MRSALSSFKTYIADILEKQVTSYVLITIMLLLILAPIIFTIMTSFKALQETYQFPPTYYPHNFTLSAYKDLLFNSPVPKFLLNSFIIAGGTTVIVLTGAVFTAYGLSQYTFKGSSAVLMAFLTTRIIPPISLLIPFYIVLSRLNLINTYWGLIILNTFLWYPLSIWMLKSFFDNFPPDLIDAAIVDGCSRTGAFLRVVIPVTAVGIAAVAIIVFLFTWNEFLFAIVFTNTREIQPITVGAHYFIGDESVQWNRVAATAMFASLPGLIFFSIAQRAIVKGLTKGALD